MIKYHRKLFCIRILIKIVTGDDILEIIKSKENRFYKKLKKLKQKKYREENRVFLAEGWKFLQFSTAPVSIIYEEGVDTNYIELGERFDCPKIYLTKNLFSEISSQENSQGVIVIYKIETKNIDNLSKNIVVLNEISDPGNLGTIIRVVEASGFKDIILTKGSVDCYNEKVVRSSMGSILNCNLYYIDEERLVEFLKERDYNMISTALDDSSIPYTDMKLKDKNAFIFGNEGNGIKKWIIDNSDEKIIIPIYGVAESLNVAMATGIVIYKVREIINMERGKNV